MDRFLVSLSIDACKAISTAIIVMTLAAVGSARADEGLPSQEQALARALENHPDIVAAKAKIALAEAELYGKRIEVSRQVLGLYGSLKMLDAKIDAAKASLNQSKAELDRPSDQLRTKDLRARDLQAAEAQLVQAIGQREQAEKELRLLIGAALPAAEAKSPSRGATAARQTPQDSIIEAMNRAQDKPIQLQFDDMPLQGVMETLSNLTGIKFSLQMLALDTVGVSNDVPISLQTNEVPLDAALQAIEDALPGLQFVLRDYGVLLTTKDYAQEHGYVPVLERGKESGASSKSR